MTTKQMDYCIELARTLNFSRAADNLFVSQPTFPIRSVSWRRRSAFRFLSAAAGERP